MKAMSDLIKPNLKLESTLKYSSWGWSVIPLHSVKDGKCTCKDGAKCGKPGKHPILSWIEFQKRRATPEEIRAWWTKWPWANVAIITGLVSGIIVLDVDGEQGVETLRKNRYAVPITARTGTGGGGWHHIFNHPGFECRNFAGKTGKTILSKVDFRADGGLIVAPPSIHLSGKPYEWIATPEEENIKDAPSWLLDLIRDQEKDSTKKTWKGHTSPIAASEDPTKAARYFLEKFVSEASNGNRNDTGMKLAAQLRDLKLPKETAKEFMLEYVSRVPQGSGDPYTEREAMASLDQAYNRPPRDPAIPGNGQGREKPLCTDLGNAIRFCMQYTGMVRYCPTLGWFIDDGKRLKSDETGQIVTYAKKTVKTIFSEANQIEQLIESINEEVEQADGDEAKIKAIKERKKDIRSQADNLIKWAVKSQARSKIDAIIALAQSEPGIATAANDFDADPWLLNCQNGTYDLRTQMLLPHDPNRLITKISGVDHDPSATCPTWLTFLNQIFEGDQKLIEFIRRAVGYSLTGDTSEQVLFFLYGTGRNGKSTFTGILQELLKEYATKTPADTLLSRYDGQIRNDLARLKGARMVIAQELPEGRRLDENTVKDLTGQDIITARFLHREYFEFLPQFKLWIYGNHKPVIRGTDEGIWRRILLIPFAVTIEKDKIDRKLPEKLKKELPGVLNWALSGCFEWKLTGLRPCKRVQIATKEYRNEEDILSIFLNEYCTLREDMKIRAQDLFDEYLHFCEKNNEQKPSRRRFSQEMKRRGFSADEREGGTGKYVYKGIGLRAHDE